MLNFVLFSLLLMVDAGPIVVGNVCNEGSEWECECTSCWKQFEEIDGLEWIRFRLDECSKVNATGLREKLAGWLNEECASFVSCPLSLPIVSSQIVIGYWGCEGKSTEIRVVLLKKREGKLSTASTAPSWLLGQVIRARQHLVAFVLHAGFESIDVYHQSSIPNTIATTIVTRKTENSTKIPEIPKSTFFVFLLAIVTVLLVIFCLLSLYCTQNTVQWTRVVKGRWRHKTYRKVAVNRNSTVDSANE